MSGPTMTILKLRNEMVSIIEKYDDNSEMGHRALDELFLDYIGNDTIKELFDNYPKYYA